jgi:hypothetical protein
MNEQPLWERALDLILTKIDRGTQHMIDTVDVQPWTHAVLSISLWFTISYLKNIHPIFFLGWLFWVWYCVIIIGAVWRTGHK